MTYYKDQLRFTNSPMDNFVVYQDGQALQDDYKALDRAMRVAALKWLGSRAIGAVTARTRLIAEVMERVRI